MLLFDDTKKLEKALGEEAAAVIAHVFEQANEKWRHELATKADLENGLLAVRADLEKGLLLTKSDLQAEIARGKHDIRRWMVGGFLAQSALLIAVIAFLK